jgi:hypothetical protein
LDLSEMANCISSVRDRFPQLSRHGDIRLPRVYRAMAGWRKRQPSLTRAPPPAVLVYAVAGMLLHTEVVAALALLMMFSTYARPAESLRLLRNAFVPPGSSVAFYSINLNPEEGPESSKVGARNESIMLDDPELPWLGLLMDKVLEKNAELPLFPITASRLGYLWAREQRTLGLKKMYNLRDLRHGGPSRDRARKHRSLEEVRQRGRWGAFTTLRRYEAHARLQAEENRLPLQVAELAANALRDLEALSRKFTTPAAAKPKASSSRCLRAAAPLERRQLARGMQRGASTLPMATTSLAPRSSIGLRRSSG